VKSGRSVEVSLNVPVGVRGSLGGGGAGSYMSGTSPALILKTGGGSSYVLYPVVVPDVSSVSCG